MYLIWFIIKYWYYWNTHIHQKKPKESTKKVDKKPKGGDEAGEEVGVNKAGEAEGENHSVLRHTQVENEITISLDKQLIRGGGTNQNNKATFFTTNSYPESANDDEKLGLTIKGTTEEFKIAHAKTHFY